MSADATAAQAGTLPRRAAAARALLAATRPRQWTKNVLVLAAPAAAGALDEWAAIGPTALALIAFCLASSATYLVNDVCDAEADRHHPTKRLRPVAAGRVSARSALLAAVALAVAALVTAGAAGLGVAAVLIAYLATTTAYTFALKRVAVLDLALVASGFVLRGVAGALAADVPISRWFFAVVSFGALFVVAGKRYAEYAELDGDRAIVRSTLAVYSREYLRFVWMLAVTVAVTAYCAWAFGTADPGGLPWNEVSILPFLLAVLRYALLLEQGVGGAPEDVMLGDRGLQLLGAAWLVAFLGGVYVGG